MKKSTAIRKSPLAFGLMAAVLPLGTHSAQAADLNLRVSDPANTSSFTNPLTGAAAGWGASGVAPTSGNDYFTGALLLRTPTTGSVTLTFPGDSLTIGGNGSSAAGRFIIKSNGSTYNATYKLNGGLIDQTNASANSGTLGGTIELLSGGGNLGASSSNETLNVTASISGSGALTINPTGTFGGSGVSLNGTVSLKNANTFTGDTRIVGGKLQIDANNASVTGQLQNSTLDMATGDTGVLEFRGSTGTTAATFGGLKGTRTIALRNTNASNNAVALSVGNNNQSTTYSGALTDSGSLIKIGTGTLTLSGPSTYAGGTTVSNGKLRLANTTDSATGTGALVINGSSSTTVSGTGSAAGNVTATNGSRIAAGSNTTGANGNFGAAGTLSLATLATSTLTLTNANLDFDLASIATIGGNVNDLIITDALSLGSVAFTFNALTGTFATGTAYTLIDSLDAITGFNTANISTSYLGVVGPGYTAAYSVDGGTNSLQVAFTAIPEPSTPALIMGGIAMMALLRRRRA